jgi:hypothetical protein
MLSDSLGQSWSPSPTQSSAQVIEEDDQQHRPQQESSGSEAIVFEKKWIETDVGGQGAFHFLLRPDRPFPDHCLVVSPQIRLGSYGC